MNDGADNSIIINENCLFFHELGKQMYGQDCHQAKNELVLTEKQYFP